MKEDKGRAGKNGEREFTENPYTADSVQPEDIVRLFYSHNVPVIPVISKRGILIGVLRKEDVVAELSDIDRARNQKIDTFITGLARRLQFSEVVPFLHHDFFVTINIFGEIQDTWSRLRFLQALENPASAAKEVETQKDEQVLEWMIYLILEHIPRPLYALNEKGKTIFYNSFFEDFYISRKGGDDVDTAFVEQSLASSSDNVLQDSPGGMTFHNTSLDVDYERVPMMSKGAVAGYLVFITYNNSDTAQTGGPEGSLQERVEYFERNEIVRELARHETLTAVAKTLGTTVPTLKKKIERYSIEHSADIKKKKKNS